MMGSSSASLSRLYWRGVFKVSGAVLEMSKLLARVPIKPRTPQLDREAILSSSADRRSCWGFDCFYGRLTEFRDSTTSLDESRDASKSLADCEFLEARP